jgi:peptidyl-prolyl cis-trans isomerase SurA
VSNVVKSKFGLHIIQLVSRFGDDAVVRHILMIPPVGQDEINESKAKLDSIRGLLVDKKMSFGEAVSKFSDEEESKFTGGFKQARDGSTAVTIDELDKDIIPLLKNLKPGEYSQPQVFTTEQGKQGLRLVYLLSRSEPHRMNLKDDYNRIATQALEEKKQSALEKWFSGHISNYYIYLDPEYQGCQQLDVWEKQASLSKQ